MPNAISREAVFARGKELLVTGGLVGGTSQTAVVTLDPHTGHVTTFGRLAVPTHDAASFALGARDVVVGGGTIAPAGTVQSVSEGGAGAVSATLSIARADATGAALHGTGYVVGGYDGPAGDPGVLATRDGKTFTTLTQLPVPVRYPAVSPLGNDLYVFGGTTIAGTPVDTIQRIDTSNGRSQVVGHLPLALGGATAATLNGTIYIVGGRGSAGDSTAVSVFSPQHDTTTVVAHLPVGLAYGGATVLKGRLYLLGGENSAGAAVATAEVVTATTR